MQSLNDLGLHHQFLIVGAALKDDKAYLQANSLHRPHVSSHQFEADIRKLKPESAPTTHVAAASNSSLATEVAAMTEVVGRLAAALTQSQLAEFANRPMRSGRLLSECRPQSAGAAAAIDTSTGTVCTIRGRS